MRSPGMRARAPRRRRASPRFARATSSGSSSGRPTTAAYTPRRRSAGSDAAPRRDQPRRARGRRPRRGARLLRADLRAVTCAAAQRLDGVRRPGRPVHRALRAGATQPPDDARHIGLVVDDREAALAAAREAGAERCSATTTSSTRGGTTSRSSTTATSSSRRRDRILEGMGLDGLEKSERALAELRAKGLAD